MARCNETRFHSYSKAKIDTSTEVTFDLQEAVDDCNRINTKSYVSVVGNASYKRLEKPENKVECYESRCRNTATLHVTAKDAQKAAAIFRLGINAVDFAAGFVTFYVQLPDGIESQKLEFSISETSDFVNADTYNVTIDEVDAERYAIVTVSLATTPDNVAGEGWTASQKGAYIKIANTVAAQEIAISSISIFDSLTDIMMGATLKLSCLSEITNDITAEVTEATCEDSGYDTSSDPALEITLTGKMVSGDYWKLNPYAKKGLETEAFTINTEAFTATAENGYAILTLADHYQRECGFVGVQLDEPCDVGEATLDRIPYMNGFDYSTLNDRQYMLKTNDDGTSTIYVSADYVGRKLLVSYPRNAEVDEILITKEALGNRRVRMSYPQKFSDGTEYNMVYNNVLITSFPGGFSSDESDISVTVRLLNDKDGAIGHQYKIVS